MIYLDHSATSFPKPDGVFRAMEDFARSSAANPGRSGHRRAVEAEAMLQDSRRLIGRLVGCTRPERIIFTLNATDASNMGIKGLLKKGDHVVTSTLEHNSISRPLNRLERDGFISLTRISADSRHFIDPDDIAKACRPSTRLVAITHASNVTGTVQPVRAIGKVVREKGALLLVDAAQSAGVIPIDVQADNIDLLVFTGHKALLGPTGTGGLVVGERADLTCWREGGTGGDSTSPIQPTEYPHHLEGGTPNVHGIAGLREGVRILLQHGVENVWARERELVSKFFKALRDPARFEWYGADRMIADPKATDRVGLVCLNVRGFSPIEVASILDQQFDIAVRAGLHCAPYAHRGMGTLPEGAVRFSVGFLTTEDDVLRAAGALDELVADSAG